MSVPKTAIGRNEAPDRAKAGGSTTARIVIDQPYPGLRSFTQDEAALFFGREVQARQLRDILAERNLVVVLGGSGSGKSSLVRAGLLPKLNSTAPIPKRSGAWYVVEFRPRTDPAREMFEAIYQQIFQPLLADAPRPAAAQAESVSAEASAGADAPRRDRCYQAVSAALKIEPPLQPGKDAQTRCKEQLRSMLFTKGEFDVGALFEFADETIVTLDEKLARRPRSGRANLLLLIDQFEEVFSLPPEREKQGLNLVMSLVTSIQTYRPFNLFLIVTMRNEWLHRCSEFPGVAEAMNGSTYLVDLLAGPDIEKVIVEPARSVLGASGLAAATRAGPYSPETLRQIRDAFEDESGVAHAPDHLPLLQHLLPLVWDQAVQDWTGRSQTEPFSVDLRHLEAVPGWTSANPLSACLNANAESALARAMAAAKSAAPFLDDDDARRLLQVAFSCLAVLDDKGIVRRRFATIDQMLSAAGIVERNPEKRGELKKALSDGLEQFRSATLIDYRTSPEGELFDINHEALVRNWDTYAEWVKDARDIQDRLIELDRKAQSSVRRSRLARRAPWLASLEEFFSAASLRSAADDVGSETGQTLTDEVFGSSSTFSRDWVLRLLGPENFVSRQNVIHTRIDDAQRFRKNPWNTYRPLVSVGGLLATVSIIAGSVFFYFQWRLSDDMERLASLQSVAYGQGTSDLPNRSQLAEAYALTKVALSIADEPRLKFQLQQNIAEATLVGTSQTLTSQLSRTVWLRDKPMTLSKKKQEEQSARCMKPGNNTPLPAREGIAWTPDRGGNWSPNWHDSATKKKFAINIAADDWASNSVICTSPDGNWQFIWLANEGDASNRISAKAQPVIRNIEWIRRNPLSGTELAIQVGPPRRLTDKKSHDAYPELFRAFEQASTDVGKSIIKFVKDGHWVGFSVPIGNGKTMFLWTVAGVEEPEEIGGGPEPGMTACVPAPKGVCKFGPLPFRLDQSLPANKNRKYSASVGWDTPQGFPPCQNVGAICPISTRVEVTTAAQSNLFLRKIERWSTSILEGTLSEDGYLWLRDDAGQFWRYLVDPAKLLKLHEDTWRGDEELVWTKVCEKLACSKELPSTEK